MSRWRKRLLVVVGVLGLWTAYTAIFGGIEDRFTVSRDVVVEPGFGWFMKAIVATEDGGQVVAGSQYERYRWASRLNANGTVRWTYRTTPAEIRPLEEHKSEFFGVAQLSGDSTVLCGTDFVSAGSGKGYIPRGLLTRIDATGKVIDERVLSPHNDDSYTGSGFYQCLTSHDGFIAVGTTSLCRGPTLPPPASRCIRYHWLLAFDADGRIRWETLETAEGYVSSVGARAAFLPNGNIAILMDGNGTPSLTARVLRFSSEGKFLNVLGRVPYHAVLVEPPGNSQIEVISIGPERKLFTFSASGSADEEILPTARFIPSRAYRAKDGSLVLTGYSGEFGYTAAIERITRSGRSALRLNPLHTSFRVEDAVPTSVAGEFATVRSVRVDGAEKNDSRNGVWVTTVRLRRATPFDVIAEQVQAVAEPAIAIASHPLDAIVAFGIAWVNSRTQQRSAESPSRPQPTVPQPPLKD